MFDVSIFIWRSSRGRSVVPNSEQKFPPRVVQPSGAFAGGIPEDTARMAGNRALSGQGTTTYGSSLIRRFTGRELPRGLRQRAALRQTMEETHTKPCVEEAFVPLVFAPGDACQFDWSHSHRVDGTCHDLNCDENRVARRANNALNPPGRKRITATRRTP